jgi:preprotein translocase subunit SecG
MGFIVGLLTVFLVLDCTVLVLLVLIQLPKKEAGAGLAFGGAASDALFGAGSGNVLTKVTKYAATIFFVMAIMLSFIQNSMRTRGTRFTEKLSQEPAGPVTGTLPPGAPGNKPATPGSNLTILPPGVESTNLSAKPGATNLTSPPPSQ